MNDGVPPITSNSPSMLASATVCLPAQFAALCSDGPTFRKFDIIEVYGD